MALINNLYVFVESEEVQREINSTSHPVEKDINITDHVTRNPIKLLLKGRIVGEDSWNIQSKLIAIQNNGTLISYKGRVTLENAQIKSFSTSHLNTVWGGCIFNMQITEVKIAQNSYNAETKNSGTQQKQTNSNEKNVYHTVKKGDTLWALVAADNAPYKSLGKNIKWLIENNPNAFSVKGDAKSLKVGAVLNVGERK